MFSRFSKPEDETSLSFLAWKSGLALFFRFGSFVAVYLFTLSVTRMLGAEAWGTFTLTFTVIQVLAIFSLWGLDNLIVRSLARKERNDIGSLSEIYTRSLIPVILFSLVLSVGMYAASGFLADTIFEKPGLRNSLQTGSLILFPWSMMLFHSACFRGLKHMTGFTAFRMSVYLLGALGMVSSSFFLKTSDPVKIFLFSSICVMTAAIISWKLYSKTGLSDLKLSVPLSLLKESTPLLITGSVFFILGWADNIFLGIYKTTFEVGIYDAAFKIAAAPAIVLIAINAIQAPVFSSLYHKGEMHKLRKSVERSSKLLFLFSVPVTVVIWMIPEFLLGIFGTEFRAGRLALCILAFGSLINAVTGSVGILLQMTGRQRQYNNIVMTAAGLNIALNILLIPSLGITGAAIASATSKVIQNVWSSVYVYKVYNFATVFNPFSAIRRK